MNLKYLCTIVACILTYNAQAASLCGKLTSDGWIEYDGTEFECLIAANRNSTRTNELETEYWQDRFSHVCVQYQSISVVSNNLSSLTYCTIETYACNANEYYTDDGCMQCSNNNYGGAIDGHSNRTCGYCYNEHYYYSESDDNCYPCPNNGYANDIESPITDCYIVQNKTGLDQTGTYEMSSTKCYWTE